MHSGSSLVAFVLSTNFEATMLAAEIGKVTQKYDGGELELRSSYIYLSRDVLLFVKHSFASLSSRQSYSREAEECYLKPRPSI